MFRKQVDGLQQLRSWELDLFPFSHLQPEWGRGKQVLQTQNTK